MQPQTVHMLVQSFGSGRISRNMSIALAQGLADLGYELVSTGGSASAIEAAGLPVRRVEELTGFPEMLDGALSL